MADVPAYLRGDVEDLRAGSLDPSAELQLLADLLIAGAVPDDLSARVDALVLDGALTRHGDIVRWPDEDTERDYNW